MTILFGWSGAMQNAVAEPFTVGPKVCKECHIAEYKVTTGTKHFTSVKTVHKDKRAKKIVRAVGDKRMKKSDTCKMCHYTEVQKKAGGKRKIVAGPSCESCHGPASNWLKIHNDYGKGVKRDTESAAHKTERLQNAEAAGMVLPSKMFDVATNCMSCHGLAAPGLDEKSAAVMLDNGHPLNPDFELVAYSQGTVRHRFYPPDVTTNKELSAAEKSQLYVVGQAAALVRASAAIKKSTHEKYMAAQKKRIATATAALEAVKGSVPAAGALFAGPSGG
ncbi:MAG: multiheme c-type cytochrome, partial [Alphaproteobacteria bacterium]